MASDPRDLTAFSTTRSEIIVAVLDGAGEHVVGILDVESVLPNAFGEGVQSLPEACSKIMQPLWNR